MPHRPLAGVRVLDLTNVLAGPYCTYQLGLLGAEILKVEIPGTGDLARHLGPDPELNEIGLGVSFLAQNAGKQSVELDLKTEPGRARFVELVRRADVLVENFRAGVLGRLGFAWPYLRELNPALIYCAISGFGQSGPMRHAPAYDQVIQGLSARSPAGTATARAASSTSPCWRHPCPRWAGPSPTTSSAVWLPSRWVIKTPPPRHPARSRPRTDR
jgi:crotonobetainyl-CoA:carnitine CoA-transferase CaiB-like acyl-CoA transferase